MTKFPPHHHASQAAKHIRCPICGEEGVMAFMIENGLPITKLDIRKSRWKAFRRVART